MKEKAIITASVVLLLCVMVTSLTASWEPLNGQENTEVVQRIFEKGPWFCNACP